MASKCKSPCYFITVRLLKISVQYYSSPKMFMPFPVLLFCLPERAQFHLFPPTPNVFHINLSSLILQFHKRSPILKQNCSLTNSTSIWEALEDFFFI